MAIHTAPDNTEIRVIQSASTALAASLAAAAAERLVADPTTELSPPLRGALARISEVVATLADLSNTEDLASLLQWREDDPRESVPLLPYALVAGLAPRYEERNDTVRARALGDWLRSLSADFHLLQTAPNVEAARRVEAFLDELSNVADDSAHESAVDRSIPGFRASALAVFA